MVLCTGALCKHMFVYYHCTSAPLIIMLMNAFYLLGQGRLHFHIQRTALPSALDPIHLEVLWDIICMYNVLGCIHIDTITVLVPVRVIHTSEACTSGAFTVTRTSTNTSFVIKNFVKIVKSLQFLANVYSTSVRASCTHTKLVLL